MSETIQALIFDFDGLLVDTETPAYESWVEIYRQHGAKLPRQLYQLDIGTAGVFDPIGELQRLTGKVLDEATILEARQTLKEHMSVEQPLLPGVAAMLQDAQALGLPIAVASSSSRRWVEGWLERHAIRSFFHCVVTSDDVAHVKPAPDLFLGAAACLSIAPAHCLVFEDAPNGMLAAAAAGIRCVAVPGPITADLTLPPVAMRLSSLAELPLRRLLAQLDHEH
ncbi:MAG: HAD family hydrolase [Herpetosiphonaceae bacterium]|nr:HAD family hydrolase [Herpetosiphonaceae bacterium]